MNDRWFKKHLKEHFQELIGGDMDLARRDETVKRCAEIMRKQAAVPPERRLNFWQFLSGVFRFTWVPIVFFQTAALLLVALFLYGASRDLKHIPAYIPLFVLASVPVIFQEKSFGTSELEAVTRSSGAQIVLAKLILSGAADLICMTMLLGLEVRLTGGIRDLGRMILYCLVPYLVCMTILLRLIRSGKKDDMTLAVAMSLASCLFWRASSRVVPGLYELSAAGVWIAASVIFSVFFAREIFFIVKADREGEMYGTVV